MLLQRRFIAIFSVETKQKVRNWLRAVPVLLALCSAGCFETSQVFTINPDGSGKVVLESRFQTLSLKGDKLDNEQLKKEVLETMEKSEDIEAWRDVSYRIEPDGRIYFKGTAYFKDINALDLDKGSNVQWRKEGDDRILTVVGRNEEDEEKPEPVKLTDAEIRERIQAEREQWKNSKPLMESMMNTLKIDAVFQLCGPIQSANNLKKTTDTSVFFSLDGARMVRAIDSLMSNDDWMARKAKEGALERPEDGPPMGADVNELTFGQKGAVTARVSCGAKPQFDYAAEVEKARTEYQEILDNLKDGK